MPPWAPLCHSPHPAFNRGARRGVGLWVPLDAEATSHGDPVRRAIDVLGPLGLVALFAALAAWSWGKWTDVQIDFGTELYLPWRISLGDALYRDLASRNGPLSHHLNALWFLLFGVSLRTLVFANLAILAAISAMTWAIFRSACGAATATGVCAVLLTVFGFSQYVAIGNYNYVTPYQHAQTHGLALSIAMLLALARYLRSRRLGWMALAGACLGLVLLTKAEIAVAAVSAAVVGGVCVGVSEPRDPKRWAKLALAFAGAACVPPLLAFAWLAACMPPDMARVGVLGNWAYLDVDLVRDHFYVHGAGFDRLGANLARALGMGLAIGALPAAAWAVERTAPPGRWRTPAALVAAGLGYGILAAPGVVPWLQVPRGLPVTTLAIGTAVASICWQRRGDREAVAQWGPLVLWSVFALVLLGKMILRARIHQYGFALAMPATLLLVAALVRLLPAWSRARLRGGLFSLALGLAGVAAGVGFYLQRSNDFYAHKDFAVGSGGDRLLVEPAPVNARGPRVAETLARLGEVAPVGSSLLVLPEGLILNYWLRLENPARYGLFLPTEIAAAGGGVAMLDDVRAAAPDTIVLMHRDLAEFGTPAFGKALSSGLEIFEWVQAHYERTLLIGPPPFGDSFGIEILRRRAGSGGPSSGLD